MASTGDLRGYVASRDTGHREGEVSFLQSSLKMLNVCWDNNIFMTY